MSKSRRSRQPVRRQGTVRQPGTRAAAGPQPADRRSAQRRAAAASPGARATPSRGARAALERVSTPLVLRMSALPGWVVPALMLAIAVAGLLVGGPVGFVLLLLVAVFLAWLAALSWPVLAPRTRLLRVLVPLAVLAAAIMVR